MENRRVRMTKKLLKDALMELLRDRPLEKVTVKDICDLADVNRSTFYDHYNDVYDLLAEIEGEFLSQLPIGGRAGDDTAAGLLSLVCFIKEHEDLYVAIRKYWSRCPDRHSARCYHPLKLTAFKHPPFGRCYSPRSGSWRPHPS